MQYLKAIKLLARTRRTSLLRTPKLRETNQYKKQKKEVVAAGIGPLRAAYQDGRLVRQEESGSKVTTHNRP